MAYAVEVLSPTILRAVMFANARGFFQEVYEVMLLSYDDKTALARYKRLERISPLYVPRNRPLVD